MKHRQLGLSGLAVSEIGMGTMTFGSMADESAGLAILDNAFDAGVDLIDIAEVYPVPPDPKWAGRTEEICGKWLADKPRECGLALVTFAIAWSLAHDFVGSTLIGATSPEQLDESLAASGVTLPDDALAAVNRITREIQYPMGL